MRKIINNINFARLCFFAITTVFLLPSSSVGQSSRTAVQFLLTPPDAYGQSMGFGGSAFSFGAVSAFYNPANLVTVNNLSVEISRNTVYPQLADDLLQKNVYVAGLIDDSWGLGVGVNYLSWEQYNYNGETHNSYDLALSFSGALRFDKTVSVGATVKFIRSQLGLVIPESHDIQGASSIALDFGIRFKNLFPDLAFYSDKTYYDNLRDNCRERNSKGITIGVSVVNLGSEMSYIDESEADPLPRNFRVGVGYQAVDMEQLGLRFTIDATKLLVDMDDDFDTEWREIDWAYGAEATFYYLVSIRAGRHLDRRDGEKFWTIGFGLGPEWLRLNYSRVLDSDDYRSNRRAEEQTYSVYCNLPSRILNW